MGGDPHHLTCLGAGELFAEMGLELPHRQGNYYYSCHGCCSYCDHARPIGLGWAAHGAPPNRNVTDFEDAQGSKAHQVHLAVSSGKFFKKYALLYNERTR
jgi:hypothetical protein